MSRLVATLGPELSILTEIGTDDLRRVGGSLLADAVGRLRRGEVRREAGYDGEYGVVALFGPGELDRADALFDLAIPEQAASPARASQRRGAFGRERDAAGAAGGGATARGRRRTSGGRVSGGRRGSGRRERGSGRGTASRRAPGGATAPA